LAKEFDDKGMHLDAAQRYRKVMQVTPDAWEAKYDLAVTLAKAKQTGEASSLLTSLEEAHPKDTKILSLVASTAEDAGNLALAVNALKGAIAADPNNPDRYLDCTRVLMDLDRNDEAAEIVKRGITQVPDPYALNVRLGAIEMMRGNHEKATIDYQQAIAAHPEVALGYVALAQTYMKDGDLKQALKVLTDGRSKAPPEYMLEYVFGLVSSELGQQDAAIAAFLHSIKLKADWAQPHYQLGIIHFQQGQLKEAQEDFENVLRLDDSNASAYFQLSRIYARTGNMPKAHEMAAKAQELNQTQKDQAMKAEKDRLGSFQPQ
jgi:tetratricopeptide (TPR) repeat protein